MFENFDGKINKSRTRQKNECNKRKEYLTSRRSCISFPIVAFMLFADVATAIADAAANTASSSMLHILAIIDAVHYHRHRFDEETLRVWFAFFFVFFVFVFSFAFKFFVETILAS